VTMSVMLTLLNVVDAWACSSCFGNVAGPEGDAIRLGVLSLLAVVVVLLIGFAVFFIYLRKKAMEFARNNAGPES